MTSGYSPDGKSGIAISPTAKMMIDSTRAKIGRSIKNFEKSIWEPLSVDRRFARGGSIYACMRGIGGSRGLAHRCGYGLDRRTGEIDPLQARHDDLVPSAE